MKRVFIAIFLCFLSSALLFGQNIDTVDNSGYAEIEFKISSFDLGNIFQGDSAVQVFEFSNVGTTPLLIHNVIATCGCTSPDWSKNPVLPGEKGSITIIFDSDNKIGRQNKIITVRSNAINSDFHLRISAMVIPSKKKKDNADL